jgi:hypothetical protein
VGSPGAGGRLRDRFRWAIPLLCAIGGVLLLVGGVAVPAYERLLFTWGGTALFVSLLLAFVISTPTVPATVATALQDTQAQNTRRLVDPDTQRYVPQEESVVLVAGEDGRTLAAVGERLLATVDVPDRGTTPEDALPVVLDIVVADLELATRAESQWTDDGVEVTVTGCRVGTESLFDHPVPSVFGVGLATAIDRPVRVESTVEDERLVVTCEWATTA